MILMNPWHRQSLFFLDVWSSSWLHLLIVILYGCSIDCIQIYTMMQFAVKEGFKYLQLDCDALNMFIFWCITTLLGEFWTFSKTFHLLSLLDSNMCMEKSMVLPIEWQILQDLILSFAFCPPLILRGNFVSFSLWLIDLF